MALSKISRSRLAIILSGLDTFSSPDESAEQYPTDPEVAADVLWQAYMKGDIDSRIVADLGAGTGILGIGAMLLGAKKVYFVEQDKDALDILNNNLAGICDMECDTPFEILAKDMRSFDSKTDIVIQNPPFGTREKHADKEFLLKAFETADKVYSFHKTSTTGFIKKISEDHGFSVAERMDFSFALKSTMPHHRKRIQHIDVSCFCIYRQR